MGRAKQEWRAQRDYIKERDNFVCQMCQTFAKLSIHHIIPKSMGGDNHEDNLITLCQPCHGDTHRLIDSGVNPLEALQMKLNQNGG